MFRATALKENTPPRPQHERHRPEQTLLYRIIDRHYPVFLAYMSEQGRPLPHHVQKEFDEFLKCGQLEYSQTVTPKNLAPPTARVIWRYNSLASNFMSARSPSSSV